MKKAEIVEQHVTGAAADDDADGDPQDEIVELQQRDRRRTAPQLLVLDQRAGVDPAQHDAADIGQRIPADRDRPDRDGDRVEHRKGDGEEGHRVRMFKHEVAAIERQQPLPVPLGGVAVVDRALREGEAVMGAGIDLDLVVRSLHACRDLVDDLLRRVDVGLGAGEIEFGLGLRRGQMRAVGLVGRQMRAVDRSRRLDAIGKMRRRVDRVAAAHAVADGADDLCVRRRLRLGDRRAAPWCLPSPGEC